jgi:hypothetical protein
MWIFGILTVIFLFLTVAAWKLWERRHSPDEDLESAVTMDKHINEKQD